MLVSSKIFLPQWIELGLLDVIMMGRMGWMRFGCECGFEGSDDTVEWLGGFDDDHWCIGVTVFVVLKIWVIY